MQQQAEKRTHEPRGVALIYVRVSRLEAAERALSPQMQEERCRALPAVAGLAVTVIRDLDYSGKNTKRPGFQELLRLVEGGEVRVVAAYSLSRISRSVRDFYRFFEEVLDPRGVAFVSATEAIDTTTVQGRAFMGMSAVWAQLEREQTAERITDSLRSKAARGELVGPVPLGYRREQGQVVIDEPAATLIRRIFAEYASGTTTMKRLAIWLNEQGERPRRGHRNNRTPARVFTADVVKDILKNPRYAGLVATRRRGTGPLVAGTHPALIEGAIWEACCAVRARQAKRRASLVGRAGRPPRYPLSPLLRYGRCGGSVRGDTRGKTHCYYACSLHRSVGLCDQPMARADALEAQIRSALSELCWPVGAADYFAQAMRSRLTKRDKAQDPKLREKALGGHLARLGDLYKLGDISNEQFLAERSRLLAEIERVRADASLPTEVADLPAQLGQLVTYWDSLDPAERGRVLETIFESLELDSRRIVAATPRAGWVDYFERVFLERKTGVKHAEVVTARLVLDERGWLRIAS